MHNYGTAPFALLAARTKEQFVTIPGIGRIEIMNNAPGYVRGGHRQLSARKPATPPPTPPKRLTATKVAQTRSAAKGDRSTVKQFRREFGDQGAIWFAQGLSLAECRKRVAQRERDEAARFRKAFGDQGAVWFAQGVSFSEAKAKFEGKSKASDSKITKSKKRAGFAAKIARSLSRGRK
jgi:hypothetical protein